MDESTYRTLFENDAYYYTPDGTLVRAVWLGHKLGNTTNWILAPAEPSNPYTEHWRYEADGSGAIIARYYAAHMDDQKPKTRLQHIGVTDLTITDFTRVE